MKYVGKDNCFSTVGWGGEVMKQWLYSTKENDTSFWFREGIQIGKHKLLCLPS